jgi:glycosyltransferase involved in cell wall biosynthesis
MKLAIILCQHGKVSLDFSIHLANLLKHTNIPTEVLVSRHYELSTARNNGVLAARNVGATHCLFIDSDILPFTFKDNQFFPFPQAIDFALSFRYPCVSGLYLSKKDFKPAVYEYTGNEDIPFKPTEKKFEDFVNNISFVNAVGLGFFLADIRTFDVLEKNGYFPFFEYRTDYKKKVEISEDLWFMNSLRKCGFCVMLLGQICLLHEMASKLYPNGKIEYSPLSE